MDSVKETKSSRREVHGISFLVASASFVILVAGLSSAQTILVPMMFAIFLAILASGPIYWLKSKGISNVLSIFLVTIVIVVLFFSILTFFVNSVNQFTDKVPEYRSNLQSLIDTITYKLLDMGIDIGRTGWEIDPSSYFNFFTKTLTSVVQAVSNFVVIVIMMIFMILEAASFRKKAQIAFETQVDFGKFAGVAIDVQRYLGIKTFTSLLTGFFIGCLTAVIGLDFPLLWGLIAFLLNYIPFIGSILASIPAIIIAVLQIDVSAAILLSFGYLAVNIGVSNFIEPIFMGKRLGLSVLVVFLSLIFWGWVWGPAGALMSVPLTMIVRIFFEHSPQLAWVAILMGSSSEVKNYHS